MKAANDIRETMEKQGLEESVHYILKDHLGSWTTITDYDGDIQQELSFDAWGNLRNPATWSGSFAGTPLYDRGFTGHEHLYSFGLINMNGRMYDPIMSSFLSVDNYVQQPDNSQNFNRYAYCLNNPLKYTDPSGEIFGVDDIMFAMICCSMSSVIINGIVNECKGGNFYDGSYGAFMGGLASTAVGGIFGGAVANIVGATEGFVCGGIVGASGGLAGGYAGGAVGAWCNGASLKDCMRAGIIGGVMGAATGFVSGGIQGGIYARKNGGDFWTGDGTILGEFTLNEKYKGTEIRAKLNSKNYNNGLMGNSRSDHIMLRKRIYELFNIKEGQYGIKRITTCADGVTDGARYGLSDDYSTFVRLEDKSYVAGYTRRVGFNGSELHLAPKYASITDLDWFKATAGHELLHCIHHNQLGLFFDRKESEIACYDFSKNVFLDAERYFEANNVVTTAIKLGFFSEEGFYIIHPLYKSHF